MQKGQFSDITAIASRSLEQAKEVADTLNIPKYYRSYDALLADPEIDAVYNPLPNNLHYLWSVRTMEAGKHLLCEKPLGLTPEEVESLIRTRDRCQVKAGDAFFRSILDNSEVLFTLEDALANTRVIQAIFQAAEQQRWV